LIPTHFNVFTPVAIAGVGHPPDVWEPLLAIVEMAGDEWTTSARKACLAMAGSWAPEAGDDV
jgi:hypothetical protein